MFHPNLISRNSNKAIYRLKMPIKDRIGKILNMNSPSFEEIQTGADGAFKLSKHCVDTPYGGHWIFTDLITGNIIFLVPKFVWD